MTQSQLADNIGIKFPQIQKYETGMNRVSASRLWDISKTLEVPINYFLKDFQDENIENQSTKNSNHSNKDILDSKETMVLVRSYYSIPKP